MKAEHFSSMKVNPLLIMIIFVLISMIATTSTQNPLIDDNFSDRVQLPQQSYLTDNFADPYIMETEMVDYRAFELQDLDNDDDLDIVALDQAGTLFVFRNDGDLNSNWTWFNIGNVTNAINLAICDLDLDGNLDFIVANFTHIILWHNTGNVWRANWNQTEQNTLCLYANDATNVNWFKMADMDADGDFDLTVLIDLDLFLYENLNTTWTLNSWGTPVKLISNIHTSVYDIAILDLDDYPEIIAANSTKLYIFQNTGNIGILLPKYQIGTLTAGLEYLITCDYNRDSFIDIITSVLFSGITIWYNDISPYTEEWEYYFDNTVTTCMELAFIDIQGDGTANLIASDSGEMCFLVFQNGDLTVDSQLSNIFSAGFGDLDQDGDTDFVSGYNLNLFSMRIWENCIPSLKNGGVTPTYGSSLSSYNFSVCLYSKIVYSFDVTILLDDHEYLMQKANPSDNIYSDGVWYYFVASILEAGVIHTFKFTAQYSTNHSVIGDIGIHYGPIVYFPDSNPYDLDADGIQDAEDNDDDNDGIPDLIDIFPDNPNEWEDRDNDTIGDNADLDDDNDGVLDDNDFFPYDPSKYAINESNTSLFEDPIVIMGIAIGLGMFLGLFLVGRQIAKSMKSGIKYGEK